MVGSGCCLGITYDDVIVTFAASSVKPKGSAAAIGQAVHARRQHGQSGFYRADTPKDRGQA